jgi:hypothetical protein
MMFSRLLSGQNSIVSVNPLTGAGNVVIPIYTVSNGQISVPISISYSGNGIKPKDVEGTAGMGWQLNAGGQVSRVVKGIPDDCTKDNSGAAMLGWMSASNAGATYASAFSILNNVPSCSNGASDISNINSYIPTNDDTEPDMFYVNAPGLSCQMVYDRSGSAPAFHPVNYQDMVISYTTNGGTGNNASEIASFTITNNQGIKYVFSAAESVTETVKSGTNSYFNRHYTQYVNGITYADSWSLASITDANGNGITLSYNTASARYSRDPVELFIAGSSTQSVQYIDLQTVTPQVLDAVNITNNNSNPTSYLSLTWNTPQNTQTGQTYISTIQVLGRYMQFTYNNAYMAYGNYSRAFLTNFNDEGCGTPINYNFAYNGLNTATNTTLLADSTSNQIDYWGFYSGGASSSTLLPNEYVNPSTSGYPRYVIGATSSPGSAYTYNLPNGSNRAVTSTTVAYGSLSKITNAQGGSTNIVYEPNQYYDAPSASNIQGGGIRVKQLIDSIGTGSTNNIIRNYAYVIPAGISGAGNSSGTPVSLPQYAFTIPYSGSATGLALWEAATAISAIDLSTDDHTIMYAYTTVSQTDAGSTRYHYIVPATYLSASAGPVCSGCSTTEWYPTVNYAASYSCPATTGPIANLTYSYPFIPNPNYDFERGLPLSIISYNGSGNEVSESDYTYTRSYTPTAITAFKSEDGPTGSVAKFYGHYTVFYNTSEMPYTVTKKIYDSNNAGQAQVSSITYAYGSAYHKLATQETATNSDNSTVNTFFKYVKDYNAPSGSSNANISALYNLALLNINAPVETYQQVTRNSATVTTAATLNLYSASTYGAFTNYLPSQLKKMVLPDGAGSATSPAAFAPYTITGGSPVNDPRYVTVANFDKYDNTGYLQTADDNFKHIQTSFFDHTSNRPTVVFKNASYNEVAFNDFDSQFAPPVSLFTITGVGSYAPVGSHAGNAAGIAANVQTVTTQPITKNTAAQNYILSIWINPSAAGTLTINGASTGYSIPYTTLSWTYYEMKIPAANLGTTFTLSFTSSQNISIDDVLLYPDVAEATTATYDQTGHYKIAETNTNGVSAYYINDQWGRLLYAIDQDKNIVARKQFISAVNYQSFFAPTITAPTTIYSGVQELYSNATPNVCLTDGMTYTWNFGDGTSNVVATTNAAQAHTYAANGTYTITVTVTSPILGTKTGTLSVTAVTLTSVKINYTNYCTPGGKVPSALEVSFVQGSTTVYTFTAAQLATGPTIVPGTYTINIYPTGTQYNSVSNPTGYSSVTYSGATSRCWNYTGSSFSVTDNLTYTPTIYFGIQAVVCSGGAE